MTVCEENEVGRRLLIQVMAYVLKMILQHLQESGSCDNVSRGD